MNTTVEQRQSDIIDDVIQRLKEFKPGQRFWSVRKLMQHYDVSQRVVESVLSQLASRNMISVKQGKGVFVNDVSAAKVKRIMYLCPDWPSLALLEFGTILEEIAAKDRGFTVVKRSFFYNGNMLDNIDMTGIDALIVFPMSSDLEMGHLKDLLELKIPVVIVAKELQDIAVSCVNGRGDMAGIMAAAHLINNGHEKLAVLISEPHCHDIYLRYSSFEQYCKLNNKSVEMIDCNVVSGEMADIKAYDTLSKYLEDNGLNFTALYVVSDNSAIGAMKAITEQGFSIPDEVSVIGNDGLEQGKFFHPALTSIKTDRRKMCDHIIDGLKKIFSGEGPKYFHISIEPEIIIRDSVKNIK